MDLFAGLANLTELNLYKNRLTDLPSGMTGASESSNEKAIDLKEF